MSAATAERRAWPTILEDIPMNHLPVPPLTAPRRRGLIATVAAAAILVTAGLAAFSPSGPPAGAAAGGAQAGPDSVIAKVNGVEKRQSDLTMAEEDVGQSLPQQGGEDAKRDYLVSYLTDMILLAQNAEQKRLQDGDDF